MVTLQAGRDCEKRSGECLILEGPAEEVPVAFERELLIEIPQASEVFMRRTVLVAEVMQNRSD
jgi:hypothetical protein